MLTYIDIIEKEVIYVRSIKSVSLIVPIFLDISCSYPYNIFSLYLHYKCILSTRKGLRLEKNFIIFQKVCKKKRNFKKDGVYFITVSFVMRAYPG